MQWTEPVVMIRGNLVLDPGRERIRVRGGAAVTVLTLKSNIDFVSISYFGVKVSYLNTVTVLFIVFHSFKSKYAP